MFESFEYLNRGWDIRTLETQSLRSVFVGLLLALFMLGMLTSLTIYEAVRLRRINWSAVFLFPVFILAVFRYAPLLYRRLGRSPTE
jgi:hypothetical protein